MNEPETETFPILAKLALNQTTLNETNEGIEAAVAV